MHSIEHGPSTAVLTSADQLRAVKSVDVPNDREIRLTSSYSELTELQDRCEFAAQQLTTTFGKAISWQEHLPEGRLRRAIADRVISSGAGTPTNSERDMWVAERLTMLSPLIDKSEEADGLRKYIASGLVTLCQGLYDQERREPIRKAFLAYVDILATRQRINEKLRHAYQTSRGLCPVEPAIDHDLQSVDYRNKLWKIRDFVSPTRLAIAGVAAWKSRGPRQPVNRWKMYQHLPGWAQRSADFVDNAAHIGGAVVIGTLLLKSYTAYKTGMQAAGSHAAPALLENITETSTLPSTDEHQVSGAFRHVTHEEASISPRSKLQTYIEASVQHAEKHSEQNTRIAQSFSKETGRADNVTDWARNDLRDALKEADIPEARIKRILRDEDQVQRVINAYYADNAKLANHPLHYLLADHTYSTRAAQTAADTLAVKIAEDLNADTAPDIEGKGKLDHKNDAPTAKPAQPTPAINPPTSEPPHLQPHEILPRHEWPTYIGTASAAGLTAIAVTILQRRLEMQSYELNRLEAEAKKQLEFDAEESST
ncbi:MAG TPA: hypothetical protein VJ836_05520 [Candidatus Saccharimonadales bacterium]|nr:hypothetical protein [Candidatus Saccharimonadales bacterium]